MSEFAWVPVWFHASLAAAAFGRLARGPLRPGWSFGDEVVYGFLRRVWRHFEEADVARIRRFFDGLRAPTPTLDAHFKVDQVTVGDVPCRWLRPVAGSGDGPLLVYLHGGAYHQGSLVSHGELVARIAHAAKVECVFVEYRLAPEHPLPAAIEDVVRVVGALETRGIPADSIVLAGDSAGGGLAVSSTRALLDAGLRAPARLALLCPWVDLTAADGSMVENEPFDWAPRRAFTHWTELARGRLDAADPRVSPGLGSLRGLPPLLVESGGAEMLRDQVRAFVASARASGVRVAHVEISNQPHVWPIARPDNHLSHATVDRLARFVRDGSSAIG